MRDPSASDEELIAAAGAGDAAAFAVLTRRHAPRINVLASRFLGSANDAEDVVQEAFWRAWKAMPDWRFGEAQFSTWLHRVAVNLCIDRQRRARLRRFLPFADAFDPPADDAGPDRRVAASAELEAVMSDVRNLPDRQRAALLLSIDGERSNAEIGQVLSVSEKAVESLLVRARRTLRVRLMEREGL
ncbi:sigma-70 family RNA polymerase sigma factor [Terrihabitans sp. B22-R8]|uniref:sigma-70 family RNA polymerase sigma factor n=1 Tax=Terrihabitans sp. B22-R8 TaxID=3425128 RepID=UPI00403CBAFE